jgi:hypothetical protein
MHLRVILAVAAGAAAMCAFAPVAGAADVGSVSGTNAETGAPLAGDVRVSFRLNRFVARDGRLVARGAVVATHISPSGEVTTVSRPMTARVNVSRRVLQQQRSCLILRLVLGPVTLNLLGLEVRLTGPNGGPIVLRVTGNPRGGILGRLFCSLARGDILRSQAATTARRLNRTVIQTGAASSLGMTVPLASGTIQEQQQACPILNLVLGPLDLRLLGLRVQLNRVHLTITAHQGQGVLGDLLCSLTNPPLPAPTP